MPLFLDAHQHLTPADCPVGLAPAPSFDDVDAARELTARRESMIQAGIEQALMLPFHSYQRPRGQADTSAVNDTVAAYRDSHPDLVLAAAGVVEPQHAAAGHAEIERIAGPLGLAGISFHTRFQGCPTNDPAVIDLVRRATALGLICFLHAGYSSEESVWRVLAVARAVPDARIVLLDGLTGPDQCHEACLAAQLSDNIWFDTAGCPDFEFVRRILDRAGPERVLFGSNLTSSYSPRRIASVVIDGLAGLPEPARRAVAGDNLVELLGGA
ncbi:MAG: amidohydrolase family protein [Nocardioides sp.]|uniref:amidohydrolase family protein n=1 Tax=Nocardioides sp. TaxID=35761 RepID=UPI0039E62617